MVTLSGLRQGGVALQCFADFVPTGMFPRFCRGPLSSLMFRKLYKNYRAMMARYSDALFPVLCAADLDRAGEGRLLVHLLWQGQEMTAAMTVGGTE